MSNRGKIWGRLALSLGFVLFSALSIHMCNNFFEYEYVAKSLDARRTLMSIHAMQEKYKAGHGMYATEMEFDNPARHHNIYFGEQVFPCKQPGCGANLPQEYTAYSYEYFWLAYAVGNNDNDPDLDIWSINERGEMKQLKDDNNNLYDWFSE